MKGRCFFRENDTEGGKMKEVMKEGKEIEKEIEREKLVAEATLFFSYMKGEKGGGEGGEGKSKEGDS